jgi:hypothetical protein
LDWLRQGFTICQLVELVGVLFRIPKRCFLDLLDAFWVPFMSDYKSDLIELIDPMRLGGANISGAAPYVDGALTAIG